MSKLARRIADLSPEERRVLLAQLLEDKVRASTTVYPVSHGQQAMWYLHQLAPQSPVYNVLYAVRLRSRMDVPALRRALQILIDRHPSLRTVFPVQQGKPVQQVKGHQQLQFEVIDASTWSDEQLDVQIGREAALPFDLEQGPLMRVTLFTRSSADNTLVFVFHHIVIDIWSLGVCVNELVVLYMSERGGTSVSLPPPVWQCMDYVQWQSQMLAEHGEQLWAYWKNQLGGELPVVNLPADRPRPPVQTFDGAEHTMRIDEELTRRLRALARAEGTTLYTVLLAAFQVLIHRYTAQDDIMIGSPTTGRTRSEVARTVGYFVNLVVLRANLAGNPAFTAFLAQVRDAVLGAVEHQEFPFPLLVERLRPPRDPSRSPLIQLSFVWNKLPELLGDQAPILASDRALARHWISELGLETCAMGQRSAAFDLTLTIVEGPESLSAEFQYNTDLYDQARIVRMAGNYLALMGSIVAHPNARVDALPLLTNAERHLLLTEWNKTGKDYPQHLCLHELFEAQAERTPESVAVELQDHHLTYRELNRQANQLANYLRGMGVGPEVPVGICVERSPEMVVGLLGILKAGGVYVPLDPAYPEERLEFMIEDTRMPILVTLRHLMERLRAPKAHIVCLDSDRDAIASAGADNVASGVMAENLAYLIYTSGSTGKPKGVQICHRSLVNCLISLRDELDVTDRDILLSITTLAFDIAALELYLPLLLGARVVLATQEIATDGVRLLKQIERSNATILQATPATWRMLVEGGWQATRNLKMVCGGEALPGELLSKMLDRGGPLWHVYGPTETTIWSTVCRVRSADATVSVGRPLANTQIYILDRNMEPAPIGVAGELHIGGVGLARGYLSRPDLTAEKFIPNPFSDEPGTRLYKTGDLARYLPDGNIEFLGRIDRQVKVRGFRVELGEIEAVLAKHPAIRQAVVVAREDASGGKRLVAYAVAAHAAAPTVGDLRRFLKQTLPEYMLPSAYLFLQQLPLTPNGKVDEGALPAPDRARPELAQVYLAPRNKTEELLARICAQVLNIDKVGVNDNFFDLGGASIQSLGVVAQANEAGLHLTPEMLLKYQTVGELAAAVSEPARPADGTNLLIESLGVYLPPRSVTTEDVLRACKRPFTFPLERMTGIRKRRMAGETEFAIDLAKAAVENCFANSKYDPEDIDLLICCNISRYDGPGFQFSCEPSTSLRLRRHFHFDNALTFDLSNACAGMFTAIGVVAALLQVGTIRRGMVVSGEYITHLTGTAQQEIDGFLDPRVACLTLGDAGAAVILEKAPSTEVGLHALELYTLGRYASYCIAKATDQPHGGAIMLTDSIRSSAVAIKQAVMHSALVLERSGWSTESLQHIIMHQTSETALKGAVDEINRFYDKEVCHSGNVIYNLAERGNTATTTHFVAVMDNILSGRIASGDKVVFGINGSGMTVGTALYTFDDLPDRLRQFASTGRTPQKLASDRRARRTALSGHRPKIRVESVGTIADRQKIKASSIELARAAAEDCFAKSSYQRSDVDLLIFTGVYRDEFISEPAVAALLAGELGMNDHIESPQAKKTLAYDVLNGGVGFLSACHIATQMILAQNCRSVMVVASEIENNAAVLPDKRLGLRETGSAVILDQAGDGRSGFGSFAFKYYTEYESAFRSNAMVLNGTACLHFERDPSIEQYYLQCIPSAVAEVLQTEGLAMPRIDVIFPPQISAAFISRLSETLGVPHERFVDVTGEGGDLFTSAVPYALQHAYARNVIQPGHIGLFICVGSGIQVGCAIYYF